MKNRLIGLLNHTDIVWLEIILAIYTINDAFALADVWKMLGLIAAFYNPSAAMNSTDYALAGVVDYYAFYNGWVLVLGALCSGTLVLVHVLTGGKRGDVMHAVVVANMALASFFITACAYMGAQDQTLTSDVFIDNAIFFSFCLFASYRASSEAADMHTSQITDWIADQYIARKRRNRG